MPSNLQGVVMEMVFKGVVELIKTAEDRSFAWDDNGDVRAAATFNVLPDRPIRVEIRKGRDGFTVKFPTAKVVRGETVKGRTVRKTTPRA